MKNFKYLFIIYISFSLICGNLCFASDSYFLQKTNSNNIEFKQNTQKETKNTDILPENGNIPAIPIFTNELNKTNKDENINIVTTGAKISNIEAFFRFVSPEEYEQKTVRKHYDILEATVINNNELPLLISADSEISFILVDNKNIKSESRKRQYKKVRKKDIGRYYLFSLPGAIIAGGITGFTLFLGAPLAAAVFVGMNLPTAKAVRTNVKISQDLFNKFMLPIKFEKGTEYKILFFVPRNTSIKEIIITNVFFNKEEQQILHIKAINL